MYSSCLRGKKNTITKTDWCLPVISTEITVNNVARQIYYRVC